jgi:hypothetical protein
MDLVGPGTDGDGQEMAGMIEPYRDVAVTPAEGHRLASTGSLDGRRNAAGFSRPVSYTNRSDSPTDRNSSNVVGDQQGTPGADTAGSLPSISSPGTFVSTAASRRLSSSQPSFIPKAQQDTNLAIGRTSIASGAGLNAGDGSAEMLLPLGGGPGREATNDPAPVPMSLRGQDAGRAPAGLELLPPAYYDIRNEATGDA